jgi:class 3 adenylate cyclase
MIGIAVADLVLTILGGLACILLAAAAVWLLPRLARRSRFLRRLRSRTPIDRIVSWVEAEQPDLRRASAPDGTVTLLFSDIENSSRLTERLGDDRWLELLAAHNTIVRAQVDEHGGYEIKSQGDGFMIALPDRLAGRAVRDQHPTRAAAARSARRLPDPGADRHPHGRGNPPRRRLLRPAASSWRQGSPTTRKAATSSSRRSRTS